MTKTQKELNDLYKKSLKCRDDCFKDIYESPPDKKKKRNKKEQKIIKSTRFLNEFFSLGKVNNTNIESNINFATPVDLGND